MTRDRGNMQYTLRSHILVLSSSVVTQINLFCLSTIIIYHLSGCGPRGKSYVLYIYICRPYTEICSMSGLWVVWQTGGSTDCGEKISPPSVWTLRKTESILGLDDLGYILASTSDASAAQLSPPHQLQMLLNNMSWEKCIRQRRGVTAIFQRHFPPGAPLGKEKEEKKRKKGWAVRSTSRKKPSAPHDLREFKDL